MLELMVAMVILSAIIALSSISKFSTSILTRQEALRLSLTIKQYQVLSSRAGERIEIKFTPENLFINSKSKTIEEFYHMPHNIKLLNYKFGSLESSTLEIRPSGTQSAGRVTIEGPNNQKCSLIFSILNRVRTQCSI